MTSLASYGLPTTARKGANAMTEIWHRLERVEPIRALGLEPERELPARVGFAARVRGKGVPYMLKAVASGPEADDDHEDGKDQLRAHSLAHEAQVLRALVPHGVDLYVAHGAGPSLTWVLSRWIEGEHARARSRRVLGQGCSQQARRRFLDLCVAVCGRVETLGEHGFLHGDLQPNHFLVDGHDRVHLVDYELAVRIGDPEPAYAGALVHYVSPETARGMLQGSRTIPLDIASEVYSLGAVLFFLYTGQPPTDYGSARTLDERLEAIAAGNLCTFAEAGVPPFDELEAIVRRCLQPRPDDRWASFAEVCAVLTAAGDRLGVPRPGER